MTTENKQPGEQVTAVADDIETTGQQAETQVTDEDSGDENTTDQSKAKKPTSGFKRKIAKLEAEVAELRKQQPGKPQVQEPAKTETAGDGKPKLEDFSSTEDYQEALIDWKTDQKIKEVKANDEKKSNEAKLKSEFEAKVSGYNEKKDAFVEGHPDWDEVMSEFDDVPIHPGIHAALLDSDIGPEVQYYLANNPELFEKLNDPKMGYIQVNKEIAKIEVKLQSEKEAKAAPVRKQSSAPTPVKPVGSGKGGGTFDYETADYESYKTQRLKERNGKM